MTIEELKEKNNKEMQQFCIEQIDKISSREVILMVHRKDKAYIGDYKYLDYELGNCKLERQYFSYFLHLLQEEKASIKCKKVANITQFTIPL